MTSEAMESEGEFSASMEERMISGKPRDLEISYPQLPDFDSPALQDKTTATHHSSWRHDLAAYVSI
jgi:hypothetical protein